MYVNSQKDMERASFYFQIFFESVEVHARVNTDIDLLIRLFQLPVIDVDKLPGSSGYSPIQTGKRLNLKMPFIEVLDTCPLFLLIRTPRPGHTSERTCQHRVSLQRLFKHAIETPKRYIQQKFCELLHGRNDQPFATLVFTVSVCYVSSTQETLTNLTPIVLSTSLENQTPVTPTRTRKRDMATNTRPPLAPDPPETRTRSIFYFDRQELMEENRQLAAEIQRLTDLVQRMKQIVDEHNAETVSQPKRAKQSKAQRQVESRRTDYIYHPPGLSPRRK